jgi:acyl-CoA synthetase (AMP-forming)/AMP-acid ligase II
MLLTRAKEAEPAARSTDWETALRCSTVTGLLELRASSQRPIHYLDGNGRSTDLTWGHVSRRSLQYGERLRRRGVRSGDRVVIMLPTCPEYLYTFFGIIAAGAIPVPVYPPFNLKQLKQFLHTLVGVFNDSGASTIVYWKDVKPILGQALAQAPGVRHALQVEELENGAGGRVPDPVALAPSDTAMIQYTSGSTEAPKGVELTHLNLLHNVHNIEASLQLDAERDVGISWLPLYHDMGLIGTLLGAYYAEVGLVLMAPQSFLMRPRLWLQAISDYRGTITVAPNFAYNLCAARVSEKAAAGLDLSSLRVAMCGAEPIRYETYDAFLERFRPNGLRDDVFLPVYGLAESTVAATFPEIHVRPRVIWLDREALEMEGRAKRVADGEGLAVASFGLGQPLAESALKVVDSDGDATLGEAEVGEILLRGPSIMKGYFRNPELTEKTLDDGWLRTGDLGFVLDGHVYVTGRKKDLIIRFGRNYYPQDLEAVVEEVEGVRKGCVIAFGIFDEAKQTEDVCLLAETRLAEGPDRVALRQRVKAALDEALGFVPDRLELLPPHTLLKTSSGKLRRKPTRAAYLAGELKPRTDTLLDRVVMFAGSQLHWAARTVQGLWSRRER